MLALLVNTVFQIRSHDPDVSCNGATMTVVRRFEAVDFFFPHPLDLGPTTRKD